MKLALYQAETEKMCRLHQKILDEARYRLGTAKKFSDMEKQGIIHSLQIIIENSIGKAKHVLKIKQEKIPVSAYDVFQVLEQTGIINSEDEKQWKKVIGFRNTVVHEYMNVSEEIVFYLSRRAKISIYTGFFNKTV